LKSAFVPSFNAVAPWFCPFAASAADPLEDPEPPELLDPAEFDAVEPELGGGEPDPPDPVPPP
jgi:hypothetical protein